MTATVSSRDGASPRREGASVGTPAASEPRPSRRRRPQMQQQRQYVGIDLHRRCSVIVRMSEDGQVLGVDQVVNDPVELSMAVAKGGPDPEVALESTYGCIGRSTYSRPTARRCIWCTRSGCTGTPGASRTTSATRPSWPTGCAAAICPRPTSPHPQRELRELVRYRGEAHRAAHLGQGPGPRGDGQGRDPAHTR